MSGLGRARGRVAILSVSFVSFLALLGSGGAVAAASPPSPAPSSPATTPTTPPASSPDQTSAESEALAEAEQSKQPVEVDGLTTPVQRVVATPAGTLEAELSPVPVRVPSGSGWTDVNTDLKASSDGLRPTASPLSVSLSDGGAEALAVVEDGASRLELWWLESLPRPTVTGDTATYPEVAPGVDLVVRAGSLGFSQYLVVKDRAAAGSPLLDQYRLMLKVQGGQVQKRGNELEFLRTDGSRVFGMAAPRMWEATGAVSSDAVQAAEVGQSAAVGMELHGDALILTPDQHMLDDPSTKFPVVIDPSWAHQVKDYWHMVWSDGQAFNNSPTENARVGFDGWQGSKSSRVFYRFQTAPWRDKQIVSATFGHKQIHSPNGTCRLGTYGPDVELWFTGAISSTMKWATQAPWLERIASSGMASGHSDVCPASEQEWDVTALVAKTAHYSDITLGLRSANEGDRNGWRIYSHVGGAGYPFLRVQYNSAPFTPSSPWVPTNPAVDGGFVTGPDVALRSIVADPDGDEVRARTFVRRAGTEAEGQWVEGQPVRNDSSNSVARGLGEGTWWYSGQAVETQHPFAQSGFSPVRSFQVDRTAPSAPSASVTGTGVETTGDRSFTVQSGTKVRVTVPPSSPDVAKYVWGIQSDPTIEQRYPAPDVASDPQAMWHLNPGPLGWDVTFNQVSKVVKFKVRAVDWAGNVSTTTEYTVNVNTDEVHRYKLDNSVRDEPVPGVPLIDWGADMGAAGAYYWNEQNPDYGVRTCTDRAYRVTTGYMSPPQFDPAVTGKNYLDTESAFSVSAWVKPGAVSSQPGTVAGAVSLVRGWPGSIMALGTRIDAAGVAHWSVGMDHNPSDDARDWVEGPVASSGVWAHLAATYAPDSRTVQLFVDGQLVGTRVIAGTLPQAEWLGIGMAPGAQFDGVVDDVRVFSGELDAGVVNLVHRDTPDLIDTCNDVPTS